MREVLSWFHNQQRNWRKKQEINYFTPQRESTLTTCFSSLCPFLLSADIKLLLLKLSQFTVCHEIVNIPVVMIDF